MKHGIINILLLAIIILPVWAVPADALAGFWQFQRAVYYAQDLSHLYPYVSSMEVQNLKAITKPELRRKKLESYKSQYLQEPTFTEQSNVPSGVQLTGVAIAVINGKRHRGKFHYIMKQEGGRWVSWSRQFIGDPE